MIQNSFTQVLSELAMTASSKQARAVGADASRSFQRALVEGGYNRELLQSQLS